MVGMSQAVDLVRCYMSLWGWSDGGDPGSVKQDANDIVVACHGDKTWHADVELACVALTCLMRHTKMTPS
jgi:hypothetical protein